MKLKTLFILAAYILGGSLLMAQNSNNKTSYNFHIGTTDYMGDLANEFYSFTHGINAGTGVTLYLDRSFDVVAEINYVHVKGDNAGPRGNKGIRPGVNFIAGMANLNIIAKYKFTNGYILQESSKISPYLLAGFGGLYSISSGVGPDDQGIKNFTEKIFAFNFCAGAGVKYQIKSNIGIFIQTLALMPMTDKIDGWYPAVTVNGANDFFLMNSIGVIYSM